MNWQRGCAQGHVDVSGRGGLTFRSGQESPWLRLLSQGHLPPCQAPGERRWQLALCSCKKVVTAPPPFLHGFPTPLFILYTVGLSGGTKDPSLHASRAHNAFISWRSHLLCLGREKSLWLFLHTDNMYHQWVHYPLNYGTNIGGRNQGSSTS